MSALEGFLEPFVQTLIGLCRLDNHTRQSILAYDDLTMYAGQRPVAMTKWIRVQLQDIFTLRLAAPRVLYRVAHTLPVDIQMTVYPPRLVLLSYY